ncbi:MAG TPA: amino acid ABC transporter permease [Burkholderiaceae bacterium]
MNWQWQVFFQDPGGNDPTYWQWMVSAWGWTLSVALLALLVALVSGSLMGILRTVPHKGLVFIGNAWTELFRNIPLLVQIILWYHVIPGIFKSLQSVPSFILVVFALGFFTSARISEQVRAGIQSLPRGQRYAGLAVGFTLPQTYRYVLLPMAFRIVLPPLTSESMNIVKNSSVAFAVSVTELTMFAMQAQEETSRGVEIYLAVTALYFISAFVINRIMQFIEGRLQIPGHSSGGK